MAGASLDTTFGALLLSAIFVAILFGFLTVQTFLYYDTCRNDPRWQQVWVALSFVVHIVLSAVTVVFFYRSAITLWTRPSGLSLSGPGWEVPTLAGTLAASEFLAQTYLAWRSYTLNKAGIWHWIALIAILSSCSTLVVEIYSVVQIAMFSSLSEHKAFWYTTYLLAGNVVVDLLVTIPVAWPLYRRRSVESFASSTRDLLNHIIVWVLGTGLLTFTIRTIVFILYLIDSQSFVYVAISYVLASLYANSLLSYLNRRRTWGKTRLIVEAHGGHSSSLPMAAADSASSAASWSSHNHERVRMSMSSDMSGQSRMPMIKTAPHDRIPRSDLASV